MHITLLASLLALSSISFSVPIPQPSNSVGRRSNVTTPLGVGLDTGDDVSAVANGIGEFSPIEDGFLEGDNDSGDGNDSGSTAASVANGLTGGGSASASNTNSSSGSTSSFCSLTGCTSGAQSNNANSTSSSTSSSGLVNSPVVEGPLVDLGGKD